MSKRKKNQKEIEVKVILIGEAGVGKTNLINVSTGMKFDEKTKPTISSTFVRNEFTIDSYNYIVNLWDTAGQEKLKSLTKLFYKGSDIVIYVYDITSKQTFESLQTWVEETDSILENKHTSGIVGNKKDLYVHEQVSEEEAKKYADSQNMKFRLVSAKDDPKSFITFIEELLRDSKSFLFEKNNISLENTNKKKHKCNC